MKRQSWESKQTARLSAELRSKGNTREAWEEICEFHDLGAIQAQELAMQVVPSILVVDMATEDQGMIFEGSPIGAFPDEPRPNQAFDQPHFGHEGPSTPPASVYKNFNRRK